MRGSLLLAMLLAACGARTPLGTGEAEVGDASSVDAARDVVARDVVARDVTCAPRTFTLTLPSTSPWTATGLQVGAGERVRITATGTVRYGGGPKQVTDANGGNFDGQLFFPTSVLPQAVVVSLIGEIGGDGSGGGVPVPEGAAGKGPGFVGASYDRIVPTAGALFLGFNDQKQAFGDNVGSFQVTIVLEC